MSLSIGELVAYLRVDMGTSSRDIAGAQRSLDLTATSAKKMGESVAQGETKLRATGKAADSLTASSGKLRAAQLSALAAQERYNTVLGDGEASTARLASAEATLIRARERVAALKPVTPPDPTLVEKFSTQAASAVETAAKFGLMLGGFELAMQGVEYAKSGAELTTALNGVAAASHASDAEMAQARQTAIGLGKDLTVPKATAVDAAAAMEDLVKAGVSLDRAMVAARPALLLAAAANVTTADSARVLGDTLDDFHLKADQAAHVANVLAAGANDAGGGLMDLFDGLKYAGPTARNVGLDITTTTAALVELAKSGMQGSLGGTALMNMLTRLNPTAKTAKAALADLGVSAFNAKGQFVGLPQVIDQLHAAQQRLNPQQFGQAVQTAFGTRAKNAVMNFATNGEAGFEQFYKAMQAGDVQAYADKMNRGLAAGGAQLRKEVTAWAVDIYGTAEPALTDAVFWIGDKLPAALATAQHTFGPLEHEISDVMVPALHGAVDVVSLLVTGLGDAGHLMDGQRSIVTGLGTAVLGMWAAYKGYQVAKGAVSAVSSALDTIRLKALYARDSLSGIGSAEPMISGSTLALGALGVALGIAAYAWEKHSESVAASRQEVSDFTSAIEQDNGALGANTRAVAENALQKDGAYDAANKLGIGLKTLTDAALGNAAAQALVNERLNDFPDSTAATIKASGLSASAFEDQYLAAGKVSDAIGGTNAKLASGVQAARNKAAADGTATSTTDALTAAQAALSTAMTYTVDASGNLVEGQAAVGSTVNDTTQEMVQQKTAAELLKDALDTLNGTNLSLETTTNAFLDSLDQVGSTVQANAKAFNDSGTAMSQNTAEGRRNREELVNVIQAAKDQAQATADSVAAQSDMTAGLQAGNAQLKANEDRIRAAAAAAGMSTTAVDALIRSIGQLATIKAAPTVTVNTAHASQQLIDFTRQIESISGHQYQVVMNVRANGAATGSVTPIHRATGGLVDGPGTTTSDSILTRLSRREFVVKAAAAATHLPLLEAINAGIPGYASGGLVAGGRNARVSVAPLPSRSSGGSSGGSAAEKRAAAAMKALQSAEESLRFSATYSDLPKLVAAITGTASSINSAMTKLINDVHAAALKGLGNGALVTLLSSENRKLQQYANERAGIAAKMKTADQALASEKAAEAAESAKVSDKIVGEFDLGSAGVNTNGFAASSSPQSIIDALTKQKTADQAFAAGLIKLRAKGVSADIIEQFGEDGAAAAGANVSALQGASAAQIKTIDQLYSATKGAAAVAGGVVSRSMYQSGVDTISGYIKGLASQDAAVKAAASHMASLVDSQVRKDLGIHSPSTVAFGLGDNTSGGFVNGVLSNVGKVKSAASTIAATAATNMSITSPGVAVRLPSIKPSAMVDNRSVDKAAPVVNKFYITQLPNEDGAQLATRVGLYVAARSA